MSTTTATNGGLKIPKFPPHGRRILCSLIVSLLFLYNVPLRWRSASQVRNIQYPVRDALLLQMAEEDLAVWSRNRATKPPTYEIPDPASLYQINRYLSVVHVSTQHGVSFRNSFEHLRLLWFGCALHRILYFLRSHQIELDTYIVLNVGDEWVERPDFPIFSKARFTADDPDINKNQTTGPAADNHPAHPARERRGGGRDNLMIPYEELLWSYQPVLLSPLQDKHRQVLFRGGCTHPGRSTMVHAIRTAYRATPHLVDAAVACEPNYTTLTPQQQSHARCLLDYDGKSYSRRTAWYLETGSVVLRGGAMDDVLSRLARKLQLQVRQNNAAATSETLALPMVFWNANDLVSVVERCLFDDEWSDRVSRSATSFWSRYVQNGQAVWEGYLMHLLLEQSKRWTLVLSSKDGAYDRPKYDFFSTLSSTLVCPLIQDGAIPTGDAGELQWGFIWCALVLSLFVWTLSYFCVVRASAVVWGRWTHHNGQSLPLPMLRQPPRTCVPFGTLLQQGFLYPKPSPRRDE